MFLPFFHLTFCSTQSEKFTCLLLTFSGIFILCTTGQFGRFPETQSDYHVSETEGSVSRFGCHLPVQDILISLAPPLLWRQTINRLASIAMKGACIPLRTSGCSSLKALAITFLDSSRRYLGFHTP